MPRAAIEACTAATAMHQHGLVRGLSESGQNGMTAGGGSAPPQRATRGAPGVLGIARLRGYARTKFFVTGSGPSIATAHRAEAHSRQLVRAGCSARLQIHGCSSPSMSSRGRPLRWSGPRVIFRSWKLTLAHQGRRASSTGSRLAQAGRLFAEASTGARRELLALPVPTLLRRSDHHGHYGHDLARRSRTAHDASRSMFPITRSEGHAEETTLRADSMEAAQLMAVEYKSLPMAA